MVGSGCGSKAYLSMMDDGVLDDLLIMDLQSGGKKVSLYSSIWSGFFNGETIGAEE